MLQRFSRLLKGGLPLVVLAWLGSAQSEAPIKASTKAQKTKTGQVSQPTTANDHDRRAATLASFAGGSISVGDMEDAIALQVPSARRQRSAAAGLKDFLEQLVRHDLLVLEATRRGYAEHPLVIEAAQRSAVEAMTKHVLAVDPAAISLEDVTQFYEQHKREFSRPLIRRASQIELASEDAARATIAALKGADRARFAEIARERSQDARTARQGGELGYFDREGNTEKGTPGANIPRALVDATFALKSVGEISAEPIHHEGGFSVIMLTGEMSAMTKALAKVADDIREQLAQERQAHALEALLAKLRAEHKPEIHPELLDAITLEPGKPLDLPEGFPAAPPDPRAPPRLMKPDKY